MEICRKDFASVTLKELAEPEVRNDPDELARIFARACYCGQEEIIKDMLWIYGGVVDPNGHVDLLETWYLHPLTMATVDKGTSNVLAVVELLIDSGANPNRQCGLGYTALHHASKAGDLPLIKLLLKEKAAVDVTNKHGETALVKAEKYEVAEMLLRAGASTTLTTHYGKRTAIDDARLRGCWGLFNCLRDHALKKYLIHICQKGCILFANLTNELLELIFDQVVKGSSQEVRRKIEKKIERRRIEMSRKEQRVVRAYYRGLY
ncbi:MAG: hypothetical protein CMI26_14740 [Opitutae bacterium]|nr:hypothetical protein [Opitutae bacterium]|tara:strand:+ start:1532 stop:2320 length:789 start_codon:yes stop_codon:yes gene_type:complete